MQKVMDFISDNVVKYKLLDGETLRKHPCGCFVFFSSGEDHICLRCGDPLSRVKSPWVDFEGNTVFEGDWIKHPIGGDLGQVVYFSDKELVHDRWKVDYHDNTPLSYLNLQIGGRGQAVKINMGN